MRARMMGLRVQGFSSKIVSRFSQLFVPQSSLSHRSIARGPGSGVSAHTDFSVWSTSFELQHQHNYHVGFWAGNPSEALEKPSADTGTGYFRQWQDNLYGQLSYVEGYPNIGLEYGKNGDPGIGCSGHVNSINNLFVNIGSPAHQGAPISASYGQDLCTRVAIQDGAVEISSAGLATKIAGVIRNEKPLELLSDIMTMKRGAKKLVHAKPHRLVTKLPQNGWHLLSQQRSLMTNTPASSLPDNSQGLEHRPSLQDKKEEELKEGTRKSLDDFQHEEIVGPTVDRDTSPVADELRESLELLKSSILHFRKSLVVMGALQVLAACWSNFFWQASNPTWQFVPSILLSFALAYLVRDALEPMTFFAKLEERSRLRIATLSLMVTKGLSYFFQRANLVLRVATIGIFLGFLMNILPLLIALLGLNRG